ncbi:YybH family protein [Sinomicrobium sp. M5D2P17]
MTNEKDVIMNVVRDYATVLNTARIEAIPGFYTDDAIFMANGSRGITKNDLQKNTGGKFFSHNRFRIEYKPEEIIVYELFAFVTATARTSTDNIPLGITLNNTTRDFFVFKKIAEDWKIFRYMFNSDNARAI